MRYVGPRLAKEFEMHNNNNSPKAQNPMYWEMNNSTNIYEVTLFNFELLFAVEKKKENSYRKNSDNSLFAWLACAATLELIVN